jgi:hypothetical protein
MSRRVFFSFHYDRDIWRVNQVRNSRAFTDKSDEAYFFDHSLWEETKKKGDDALRQLINSGLKGASVTAVLIGAETSTRRWVKYEIDRSHSEGMGLLGVYIHRLTNREGNTDTKGANPFSQFPTWGSSVTTYDWEADNGFENFASWVEKAAKAAGR